MTLTEQTTKTTFCLQTFLTHTLPHLFRFWALMLHWAVDENPHQNVNNTRQIHMHSLLLTTSSFQCPGCIIKQHLSVLLAFKNDNCSVFQNLCLDIHQHLSWRHHTDPHFKKKKSSSPSTVFFAANTVYTASYRRNCHLHQELRFSVLKAQLIHTVC